MNSRAVFLHTHDREMKDLRSLETAEWEEMEVSEANIPEDLA
jgi:hypothetical protein